MLYAFCCVLVFVHFSFWIISFICLWFIRNYKAYKKTIYKIKRFFTPKEKLGLIRNLPRFFINKKINFNSPRQASADNSLNKGSNQISPPFSPKFQSFITQNPRGIHFGSNIKSSKCTFPSNLLHSFHLIQVRIIFSLKVSFSSCYVWWFVLSFWRENAT